MLTIFKRFGGIFLFLLLTSTLYAKTMHDSKGVEIKSLFNAGKAKYVIRFEHIFSDTLYIPHGSELKFEGGKLDGPIVFNQTKISGKPNVSTQLLFRRLYI